VLSNKSSNTIFHYLNPFLTGQVALDRAGQIIGWQDFRAQAQQVFENLKAVLAAVGMDFIDVIKLNIYVVDISQLPILREVRDRYLNTFTPPASTLVEGRRLACEEFLLQIEAVAQMPAVVSIPYQRGRSPHRLAQGQNWPSSRSRVRACGS
jgi:enamine deaminase RidA (YjgF/YER057c/UK114 family)